MKMLKNADVSYQRHRGMKHPIRFASPGLLQLTAMCLATVVTRSSPNSTVVSPPSPMSARGSSAVFTFSEPSRSFVEFRHAWPSVSAATCARLQLRFRTTRPGGILALMTPVVEAPQSNNSRSGLPPTTLVRLHHGSIHVSVSASADRRNVVPAQSGVVVGQGIGIESMFYDV